MRAPNRFTKCPLLPASIKNSLDVLESGRLHRYGEGMKTKSFTSKFEIEMARKMKREYAVAVNSCSSGLFLSLRALKAIYGKDVLMSGFTLSCVPSAVTHANMNAILVDSDPTTLTIDFDDLKEKIKATNAKILLLSHMRGHIADLEKLKQICQEAEVALLEDCAHAIGATFKGKLVGSFGEIACFSMQAFKQINGGEMGIICTDNPEFAAMMMVNSGSYMNFEQNGTCPPLSYFEFAEEWENFSLRANEISAAVALPQLEILDERNNRWREIYSNVEKKIQSNPCVELVKNVKGANPTPTSIQFFLKGTPEFIARVRDRALQNGVPMKWFGGKKSKGYTSNYRQWRWMKSNQCDGLDMLCANLIDIRLPYDLTDEECETVGNIVNNAIDEEREVTKEIVNNAIEIET